jgi:hypothetical protein
VPGDEGAGRRNLPGSNDLKATGLESSTAPPVKKFARTPIGPPAPNRKCYFVRTIQKTSDQPLDNQEPSLGCGQALSRSEEK